MQFSVRVNIDEALRKFQLVAEDAKSALPRADSERSEDGCHMKLEQDKQREASRLAKRKPKGE